MTTPTPAGTTNAIAAAPGWPRGIDVVRGSGAAGALRQAGASDVIYTSDDLATGPCSANPSTHATARRAYWRRQARVGPQHERLPQVDAPAQQVFGAPELVARIRSIPGDLQVRIWTSTRWSDQLFLCWVMDGLSRVRFPLARLRLILAGDDPLDRLNPEQFAERVVRGRRPSARFRDEAVSLWRAFASTSPQALERRRRISAYGRRLLNSYALVLPQVFGRENALRLSELDSGMLSHFSQKAWRSAFGLFRDPAFIREDPLITTFGAEVYLRRLWGWSQHRDGRFVERRDGASGYGLLRPEYRLTERGAALLISGMRKFDDAPSLRVGGYEVFSAKSRWVVLRKSGTYSFAKYTAQRGRGRGHEEPSGRSS